MGVEVVAVVDRASGVFFSFLLRLLSFKEMHSGRCRFCFFSTLRERAFRTLPRRLDKGRKGRSDGDESWAQKRRPRSPPSQSQSTNGLRPFSSSFSGALFPQKNKLSLSLSSRRRDVARTWYATTYLEQRALQASSRRGLGQASGSSLIFSRCCSRGEKQKLEGGVVRSKVAIDERRKRKTSTSKKNTSCSSTLAFFFLSFFFFPGQFSFYTKKASEERAVIKCRNRSQLLCPLLLLEQ